MIETPRLKLYPFQKPYIDAIMSGDFQKLSLALSCEIPENWRAVANAAEAGDFFYGLLRELNGDDRFGGYFVVFKWGSQLIGSSGFKGMHDYPSSVEIGYEIQPEYQKLGLATEAAQALTDFAFQEGVKQVVATTLKDGQASHRVLEKCGFERTGTLVDQEHGELYTWHKTRT